MNNDKLLDFHKFGKKHYSQNKEDGIIEEIFNRIGFTNKLGLEMCCGSGCQCNLTNLIINEKLDRVLYIDKNTKQIIKGKLWWQRKIEKYPNIKIPKYIDTYIKKDTINSILKDNDMIGEMDILSLDMDGIDYWILIELLKVINPRLIVLEFHDIPGPNLNITVPFKEPFSGWNKWKKGGPNWSGASLGAFKKLLTNYDLVGTENKGFNAFFIRKDVNKLHKAFEPFTNEELYMVWAVRTIINQQKLKDRWDYVKHLPWQEV